MYFLQDRPLPTEVNWTTILVHIADLAFFYGVFRVLQSWQSWKVLEAALDGQLPIINCFGCYDIMHSNYNTFQSVDVLVFWVVSPMEERQIHWPVETYILRIVQSQFIRMYQFIS